MNWSSKTYSNKELFEPNGYFQTEVETFLLSFNMM
jgi:hypothetical protein